ncbi:Rhodanese-like protein [Exidia glandulosa HHB12029]|uniref:Rhodanese-like protein n=1 Tax=Exidia glandulosa HHB12029 TaxID=1314781 RepID=A0A165P1Y2_EXIGL|nr:Rhodanese-like protein [Exidia glandulosa HHB12029]
MTTIITSGGMRPLFTWITAKEMREIILSKTARKDYAVIDVRDDDREGGHILHSVHSPSHKFLDSVDKLVDELKDASTVVFHCALSQQRGPKAARIYAETLNMKYPSATQEVVVLRGGFTDFQALYRNEPQLIEAWSKDHWDSEWS